MTWDEAIAEYTFDCKIRKLSPKTISNYTKQLRYFQRYVQANYKLEKVEKVQTFHIKQFLSQMDDKGLKPQYVNDNLKVLKTFYFYLVREHYNQNNLCEHFEVAYILLFQICLRHLQISLSKRFCYPQNQF